ncbi:hypothetical protein E4U58_001999, partial [Claviceps cyperi]
AVFRHHVRQIARLELQRPRQASDESFSDNLVWFEAQMARAHRLDAPEDEKEAEHRAFELRSLKRTMPSPDPNTPTPETGSEKGTNTMSVARTGFFIKIQRSKPGGKMGAGKKGAKATTDPRSAFASWPYRASGSPVCLAAERFDAGDRWGARE